jgi:FG-GAP repeat
MTLLRHATIICLSVSTLVIGPGCLDDRCETKSAQVELTVTFTGSSTAQRLEFETWVSAPGYATQRMGSMPFPSLNDGKATFLLDPGQYVHNLPEGVRADFLVMLRVYGEKAGMDDALLAEGRWERSVSPAGCYIDAAMTVSTQGTCADKVEGDPCVASSGNAYAVCMPDGPDSVTCETSTCGDGFTDRRNGEICDPGHTDPVVDCDDNCLPLPVVLRVAPDDTTDVARLTQGEKITVSHATTLEGFYAVDTLDGATDLAANILIADLDGDGQDELALGLPGAPSSADDGIDADKFGAVYVENYSIHDGQSLGTKADGMYMFTGLDSDQDTRGSWFGASLAAGDVDGNGTLDLAIGAPRLTVAGSEGKELGALYVVFSGEELGYLTAGKNGEILEMNDANDDSFQSFYGFQGDAGGQIGDHLGYAVVMADLNLDGYADLAVSAPHTKQPAIDSHGTVYVLRGGEDWWLHGEDKFGIQDAANTEINTLTINSRLGVSLATGDLNGDGYPDLIMGMTSGPQFEGGVTVLFGGEDVLPPGGRSGTLKAHPNPSDGLLTLTPGTDHYLAGMGGTVTAVDLDGDGRDELVAALGRPGTSAGDPDSVIIINGAFFEAQQHAGSALPGVGDFTVVQGPVGSRFGLVLTATDVSGDRRPDLLVSAPWADDDVNPDTDDRAGAVFAFLASPRNNLWAQENLSTTTLTEWNSAADGNIPVGLILLQGVDTDGQLGAATGGSTHLAQLQSNRECRNAYTYVMQPGWAESPDDSYQGRIYTYFLPATLPCESQNICQRLCN